MTSLRAPARHGRDRPVGPGQGVPGQAAGASLGPKQHVQAGGPEIPPGQAGSVSGVREHRAFNSVTCGSHDGLEVIDFAVRDTCGAYVTATVAGKRASSTSSAEQAAKALAEKVFGRPAATLTRLARDDGPGRSWWRAAR